MNFIYLPSMLTKLTESDCRTAMAEGDFSPELRNTAKYVALVLTQSWCPQWRFMSLYLNSIITEGKGEIEIRYIEYDREAFFEEFLAFKEDHFQNRDVPYVRYYREGQLVDQSNFLSKQGFKSKLGLGQT
ncbi:hypothetical protein MASR2M78_11400 [Treponema sp.]